MGDRSAQTSPLTIARLAGILYGIIIVFGISGEVVIRSRIIVPGDATATANNIVALPGLFRLGFVTDSVMFLSDVALAVLLFILLRPVNKTVALVALLFRLTQSGVIALNLLNYHAASLVLSGAGYGSALGSAQQHALSYLFMDLHRHGYDLGLILFGVHCALLGYLLVKSRYFPRILGILMMAAAVTYLVGSYTRFLFPAYVEAVAPIYVVALLAELAFCMWLLVKGVAVEQWNMKVGAGQAR